jgi:hypothetical protein
MARIETHGLRRSVGLGGLFATAYGNVGSSIYYALGLVAAYALGLTPIVFLLAGGLFALTAKTYAEGASMYPEAGGSSSFARHAFNEFVVLCRLGAEPRLHPDDRDLGVLRPSLPRDVLRVPSQLSLDAGLHEEEQQGLALLESAKLAGRKAGFKVQTRLLRTRNPGHTIVEEAERSEAEIIYLATDHAPANERSLGPTAMYLLARRPCRVVIETPPMRGARPALLQAVA